MFAERMKALKTITLAALTISCAGTVSARFEITAIPTKLNQTRKHAHHRPVHWLEFGSSTGTGQVILSTPAEIHQPVSKKFEVKGN